MCYDKCAFPKKRRGVNVKAKLKLLEMGALIIVMILDVYMLNTNMRTTRYEKNKEFSSTANYIDVEKQQDIIEEYKQQENEGDSITLDSEKQEEVIEETIQADPIVYDGKTLNELAELINKSLNSTIAGKGYLIVSHSIEMGVDPYMATAIILHETGCKWGCSRLVIECNNVGGQVGSGCNGYRYFNSLDEGIIEFINNLKNNYIDYGLITPEQINLKYAQDPNWATNVNAYIETIKAQ